MNMNDFLELCEKMDKRVCLVSIDELDEWNKTFGVPRNHLKEALLNLRGIEDNDFFYYGCINELKIEARLVSKTLRGNKFLDYFCERLEQQKKYTPGNSITFVNCKTKFIAEILEIHKDKYQDIYVIDEKKENYIVNDSKIHFCHLKRIYGLSQIIHIMSSIVKSENIEIYVNNERMLSDKSSKLEGIAGVGIFWSDFYQVKFLEYYTNLRINNEENAYIVKEKDKYDRMIYLKLTGLKNSVYRDKDKKESIVAFHRYKDYGDVNFLNYPHQWVGMNYASAAFYMRKNAYKYGINAICSSEKPVYDCDIIVFWEVPDMEDIILNQALQYGKKMILFATESVGIIKENENLINIILFDKIATWRVNGLNNNKMKYVPPIYFDSITYVSNVPFKQRKKVVMIASIYKKYNVKHGLYQEREKCIRWMEKYHREDFDFYGKNTKSTLNDFASYKGTIKDKVAILKQYKYCICFENNDGYCQYVSEKIYDCLFAKCVPIYLGAPDIEKYVPATCFINMRNFDNYKKLWEYIENVDECTWNNYIEAIDDFIKSGAVNKYSGQRMLEDVKELVDGF